MNGGGQPRREGAKGGEGDVKGKEEEAKGTNHSLTGNASTPWRGCVNDTKVVLHAVGACGGFGNEVCCGRFSSLYLHETFCADCLITAAGMVDIGGVVLRGTSVSGGGDEEITDEKADWTLDGAPVEGGLWAARRQRGCAL